MVVSAEEVIVTGSEDITKKSKKKKRKAEKGSACDTEKTTAIPSITTEEPVKKKKKTKSQVTDSSNNDDKLNSSSADTKIYDENISNIEKTGKRRKRKKAKQANNDSAGDKTLNVSLETDQTPNMEANSAKIAEITSDNNESTLNKTGKKKKKAKKKQRDSEAEEATLENTPTPTVTGEENLQPDDISKKCGEIEKRIKKKKTKKADCGDVEPQQAPSIKSPEKDQDQNLNPIQVESSKNVETNLSKNGSDLEKIKKKRKKEKRRSEAEDKALKSISDDVRSDRDAKKIKGPTDVENQTDAPKLDEIDQNFKANSNKTKKKKKKDQKENNSESKENNAEKDTKSLEEKDTASQKTEESKNETETNIGEIEELPNSETFSNKSRKRKKDKKGTQESKDETDDQNDQNEKSSVTPDAVTTSVSDLDQSTRNKKKKRKERSENRSQGENDETDHPGAESGELTIKKVEDENADALGGQIEPENTSEVQSAKKKKKSKKTKETQEDAPTKVEEAKEQNADESVLESKANKKSTKRKVESTISGEASKDDEGTQSCEKKKRVKKEKVSAVSTQSIENEFTSGKTPGETIAKDLSKKKKRKKAKSDEAEMNGKTAAENSKNGDGETDTGQSKEPDQNPKQGCSTANDRLGQWKTAKLSSSAQQDKFVRLLGGTKSAPAKKDSPASTSNGESILSRLTGVWKPPPGRKLFRSLMNREKKTFSTVALDEKESEELATNLENQYNKTLDFNLQKRKEGNAAKGLGFQEDPAKGKKHYIDINKVNSIALD